MWDLIVSVPDHCLSFYFESDLVGNSRRHVFTGRGSNALAVTVPPWKTALNLHVHIYDCKRAT